MTLAASPAAGQPVETFVEANGPSGVLKGTMLAPADAKGAPLAVIIPGSGPTDRDGNNPMGVKAAPYRMLAEALAGLGVATVRVDKRGMFASAGAAADANKVTMADYAADAHAWAAMLRARTGAPCVWLIGHSEGSLVALVAAKNPTGLCGLVLVAGAGRPMGEVLRDQLKANPANAPLLNQALPAIDKLEHGQHVDVTGMDPHLMPLFYPAVQDFLIDQMSYDPAKLAASYRGPVLVVQGTTDLQTSMADAERLAGARPGIELARIDGMNHVLKSAPPDRAANGATYFDPSLPLAPGVAEAIAHFIEAHRPAKEAR